MKAILSACAAVLAGVVLADPYVVQSVGFDAGTTWAYIEPTPTNRACEAVFAAAPQITDVECYDGRAYAQTAQYDSEGKPIYQKPVPFLVWHRDPTKPSTLKNVIGGRIYIIKATGAGTITLTGRPQLPQLYWNEFTTNKNDVLNLVAPTFAVGTSGVRVVDYFGEGPAGQLPAVYEMTGKKPISLTPKVDLKTSCVYAMSARRAADWGGVIGIAGADNGLTFTSNGENRISFALQNLGTTNREFRVSYGRGELSLEGVPPLLLLDGVSWTDFPNESYHDFAVAPNEQAIVTLAVLPEAARVSGSGLLTVTDLGPSKMRVRLPVVVESPAQESGLWPDGLYFGSFTLDCVTYTNATPLRAGGSVKGSLIYHQKGATGTLLQRLCIGTQTNGVSVYGLNLDSVRTKVAPGTTVRRLSSVVFDPNNPRVSATVADGKGTFTWTVDKHAPTNPMRHSWHPDHDGLRRLSNGTTIAAPDGDDFANYSEAVKPELFSIGNEVKLTGLPVSTNRTGAIEGTVKGTISWTLKNLRAPSSGGDITCTGSFSLMRVATVGEIE